MKIKDDIVVVTHEHPNSIYGEFRREEAERERKQRDIELDAQNRLLNDDLSFEEFNRRREAMRYLGSDPTVPIDEATQSDYENRRQYERAPAHRFMLGRGS